MKSGWQTKRLGDLCEIDLGKTPARANSSYWDEKKETENVWLSIADLLNADGNVVIDSKEYISNKGAALCKRVPKGTLLVSFKLTLGRLAFAGRDLYTNEAIAALTVLNERELSKDFLFWFLRFFDWVKAAENDVKLKGMTLNKAKLKEIVVRFPQSLSEQKRIVAILKRAARDIAIAKVNAEKSLQNARAIFESHLQSVLDRQGPGWRASILGEEVDFLAGFAFKSALYTERDEDVRLLRGDNIVPRGLRWDDVKKWPVNDVDSYNRYQLCESDVILAMDRPWIKGGLKYAMIAADDLPCLLVQRTARLRGGINLDNRFLMYLLGSAAFTRHILGVQTGIGVPHISGQQIKDFEFVMPPLDEQHQIVDNLDKLYLETQRLVSFYARRLVVWEELEKSLLHWAFTGQI